MLSRILQADGPRPDHHLQPHQAHRRQGHRRADRARFRGGRHPRRPRAGCPRAGAARLPQWQGRRPRRHRCRRARHRRRECHPRHQLPVPRGREDLCPPDRPHRPRGQHRGRGDLRRLGRHAPLGPDQQGPRPRHPRARGDLLLLRPPLRGTGRPPRPPRAACPSAAQTRAGLDAEVIEDIEGPGKKSSGGPGRGRSGRGSGRGETGRGGRGADDSGPTSRAADDSPRDGESTRPRRNRNRRRTRGGTPAPEAG
jgi:hypothetical protein